MGEVKITEEEWKEKIKEVFDIFDHDLSNTIDIKEIGTLLRALGKNPLEKEIDDLIEEIGLDEDVEYVTYSDVEPILLQCMMENKFPVDPEDRILKAFEVLDPERKGFIDAAVLAEMLENEGEPFSPEEIEEFLSSCQEDNYVYYEDYVTQNFGELSTNAANA
eukprot:GCRY01002014.1.p1 GENE.GCRY01002014.1~~GCRY01002014.1.p1  ORF type:complete len:163 (-),score=40.66 GCRY01002014.1:411-899(-)